VLLFTLIVATHVLTGLIALFVDCRLTLSTSCGGPPPLLCLLVFVACRRIPRPRLRILRPPLAADGVAAGDFLQTNVSGRISGSGAHLTVSRVRVAVTVIVVAMGLLALAWQIDLRHRLRKPRTLWGSLSQRCASRLHGLIATMLVGPVSAYGARC